jgi:hypothetical protein
MPVLKKESGLEVTMLLVCLCPLVLTLKQLQVFTEFFMGVVPLNVIPTLCFSKFCPSFLLTGAF